MRAISRYVFIQLVAVTIVVTVALTFGVWLIRSLRLLDYIVNRGLPVDTFLWMVVLLLPTFLAVALPISAFCAVLFIYNKLTMDSEVVVMRAAGLSQVQLAMPAFLVGLAVTAVGYSITLYFQPVSYKAFRDFQFEAQNDLTGVLLQEGAFSDPARGVTVYVRERNAAGELRGLLIHDNRDPANPATVMAERGALVSDGTNPRVVMLNGNRQQIDKGSGHLTMLRFDRYSFEIAQLSESSQRTQRHRKEHFLHELLNPDISEADPQLRNELTAEGHERLATPLSTLTFVLVGLAALLSGQFNRHGQVWRIAFAIACVAMLEVMLIAFRDMAAGNPVAIVAMYAAVLVPLGLGLLVLLRGPRRHTRHPPLQGVAAS
ncbi:MAG: LPS export ABC transporter permease LptF [Planctomycetota bacterium]|jgi:lipopolysaccharide export system permease protein